MQPVVLEDVSTQDVPAPLGAASRSPRRKPWENVNKDLFLSAEGVRTRSMRSATKNCHAAIAEQCAVLTA